jgi:type IV pilus biogenesis protein CpaD/CtpE
MNILELRKTILAVLLAFAAVMLLPACSSTEEESGSGLPCDIDPGQPECLK